MYFGYRKSAVHDKWLSFFSKCRFVKCLLCTKSPCRQQSWSCWEESRCAHEEICHRDNSGWTHQWSQGHTCHPGSLKEMLRKWHTSSPGVRIPWAKMILAWASKDREVVYSQVEREEVKFLWQTQHVDTRKDKQKHAAGPWEGGRGDNENVRAVIQFRSTGTLRLRDTISSEELLKVSEQEDDWC